ncbi:hypothetical protein CDEF62S_04824 [Castellaniella defragrans]
MTRTLLPSHCKARSMISSGQRSPHTDAIDHGLYPEDFLRALACWAD